MVPYDGGFAIVTRTGLLCFNLLCWQWSMPFAQAIAESACSWHGNLVVAFGLPNGAGISVASVDRIGNYMRLPVLRLSEGKNCCKNRMKQGI
jgi:hypothetical protein